MRYPDSASELQQWCEWDATGFDPNEEVMTEVAEIAETFVFHLIAAFLTGTDHNGDTIMLKFESYQYRNSFHPSI
jgi:hypothetical protein